MPLRTYPTTRTSNGAYSTCCQRCATPSRHRWTRTSPRPHRRPPRTAMYHSRNTPCFTLCHRMPPARHKQCSTRSANRARSRYSRTSQRRLTWPARSAIPSRRSSVSLCGWPCLTATWRCPSKTKRDGSANKTPSGARSTRYAHILT